MEYNGGPLTRARNFRLVITAILLGASIISGASETYTFQAPESAEQGDPLFAWNV
jgi:hypothetical protein